MFSVSTAHTLIKGMLASVGSLYNYWSRFPSLAIILEGLRRLEGSFAREVEVEKQLTAWSRQGYRLSYFRSLLQGRKAEDLAYEFEQLKRDIAAAEDFRRRLINVPMQERNRLERILFEDPSRVNEVRTTAKV